MRITAHLLSKMMTWVTHLPSRKEITQVSVRSITLRTGSRDLRILTDWHFSRPILIMFKRWKLHMPNHSSSFSRVIQFNHWGRMFHNLTLLVNVLHWNFTKVKILKVLKLRKQVFRVLTPKCKNMMRNFKWKEVLLNPNLHPPLILKGWLLKKRHLRELQSPHLVVSLARNL
jgi:hypothetical protein